VRAKYYEQWTSQHNIILDPMNYTDDNNNGGVVPDNVLKYTFNFNQF
jgi:hypothetical protein